MDKDVRFATKFLAFYGVFLYMGLAAIRYFIWTRMERDLIWQCFFCSLISVLFLILLGMAGGYEEEFTWKAEPLAAIVMSIVVALHAVYVMALHRESADRRVLT